MQQCRIGRSPEDDVRRMGEHLKGSLSIEREKESSLICVLSWFAKKSSLRQMMLHLCCICVFAGQLVKHNRASSNAIDNQKLKWSAAKCKSICEVCSPIKWLSKTPSIRVWKVDTIRRFITKERNLRCVKCFFSMTLLLEVLFFYYLMKFLLWPSPSNALTDCSAFCVPLEAFAKSADLCRPLLAAPKYAAALPTRWVTLMVLDGAGSTVCRFYTVSTLRANYWVAFSNKPCNLNPSPWINWMKLNKKKDQRKHLLFYAVFTTV